MLNALRKSQARKKQAERLCESLIARARVPEFFGPFGVADTIDGRFDLVTLHAWLVLTRLEAIGARDLSQAVTDGLFVGFDEALRDLGVGDMGLGRRMKKMADAFYGRLKAYGDAPTPDELTDAIVRNVYRGDASRKEKARAIAAYVEQARAQLARCDLLEGLPDFGAAPSVDIVS